MFKLPIVLGSLWLAWMIAPVDRKLALQVAGFPFVLLALFILAIRIMPRPTFVADGDGIRWSKRGYLPWSEVRAASVRSVFGIRWIVIERAHGPSWTLWWSLPGSPNFIQRVLRTVPAGNPLHACVRDHLAARARQ